jgi:hypothetical protein
LACACRWFERPCVVDDFEGIFNDFGFKIMRTSRYGMPAVMFLDCEISAMVKKEGLHRRQT